MFYCRADRDIRKERAPRNSQGKATQRKRTHETNNYCSCLRNGCAFGVCANKDHQDPTSDHDATSDHANEHLKNCNRDGDRIHGRQNDRCAPPRRSLCSPRPTLSRCRMCSARRFAMSTRMAKPSTRTWSDRVRACISILTARARLSASLSLKRSSEA